MRTGVFGRDGELRRLQEFIERSTRGPAALVLSGEPGVGKTVLWQHGLESATAAGAIVLSCRAVEAEAELAFTGLGDLLSERLDEIRGRLSTPRSRALEVALLLAEPEPGGPDPRALGMAFVDALRLHAAAAPVVVAVDDLQWLDASSLGILRFGLRRLRSERVGLLATVRAGAEESVPLGHDAAEWLRLEPISLAALHHLVRERLGLGLTRSELSRLHAATGGNPYFALEVGRELARLEERPAPGQPLPVPATLHDLLAGRLAGLDEATRGVLLSAALLSRPTVDVLAAVHGPDAERAVALAAGASLIELEGSRLRFTHPLLATVCMRAAAEGERRAAHRALAAALPQSEERARHLALGAEAPAEEVAGALARAAEFAFARGATAAAAELWGLAAELTPADDTAARRRRRFLAADAHRWAGDRARAAAMLDELRMEATRGTERADVLFALASTRRGGLPELASLCEEALAELDGDDVRAARIIGFLSWIRVSQGNVRTALADARSALERAERTGDELLLARAIGRVAMAETWTVQITPGLLERGVELEQRLGRFLEFHESPAVALERRLMCQGDFDGARSVLERIAANATEHGDEGTRGHALVHFTLLEWYSGRWEDALRHADAALELAEEIGDEQFRGFVLSVRALVELHLGRVEEVREGVARSSAAADAASDVLVGLWNRGVLGAAELALGDVAAAAAQLREVPARLTELGWLDVADNIWTDTIEALVGLGELERASAYLEQLEELCLRLGSRWVRANALRCRGLLAAAEGDLDAAFRAFDRALDEHGRLDAPFERARTLLALGSVRRRAKQKRAAREALEQALALFGELGARLWVERARDELGRIGGRRSDGRLTAAEQRVASLAAEGRSNKEIAAALFVTPHTVETHLSRVYRKLGVRSRVGLAARLPNVEDAAPKV